MTLEDLINVTSMVAAGLRDQARTPQEHALGDYGFMRKGTTMENDKKPFHESVAEKLIAQLQAGTAPWQKPWQPGEPSANLPINPSTGKRYRGINALHLMSEGRGDPRWLTYKQASMLDAQVRKGEKGTSIQYWKFADEQPLTDGAGKPVLDANGQPVMETIRLERPRAFFATVFNAVQIDGLAPLAPPRELSWSPVERAEQILLASGAAIRHGEVDRAFYRPATDSIHLPDRGQFLSADDYYATALHELGHWTGHALRLNRDLAHPFGSEGYAREELRAEIASMILGAELGIGHDPRQHAAYVGSWIKALQDDPLEIFRAAADAEKVRDYVLGLEQRQVQQLAEGAAAVAHPAAFVDTNGMLRDWHSADRVPEDWQGVVKHEGAYWYVGQEGGERTFTALAGATCQEAEEEAARVRTLAVDVGALLEELPVHQHEGRTAESLAAALRRHGLNSVGSVTGSDPNKFFERAEDRLSAVFGLAPGLRDADKLHLERHRLAQRFADAAANLLKPLQKEAETVARKAGSEEHLPADLAANWTLAQLGRGTLARALDKATVAQLNWVGQTLASMQPVGLENPFWGGRKLPDDIATLVEKIDQASKQVELRRADAQVAEARLALMTSRAFGRARAVDAEALDQAAHAALGFALPQDWNGALQVHGIVAEEVDGRQVWTPALEKGVAPQAWGVYAQHRDGALAWLVARPSEQEARELADRLSLIDARSTLGAHEKAAKLARVNEQRVLRDPNSTDEEIAAAGEARRNAEVAATVHDADLQRRIEFAERDRARQAGGLAQPKAPKMLIAVPYKEKEEAKALGAKWDRQKQSWYVPAGVDTAPFAKWSRHGAGDAPAHAAAAGAAFAPQAVPERLYLAVPYGERDAARAAGAQWDRAAKSWYAAPAADMSVLEKWKPENVPAQQGPAMAPREEFAEILKSLGCVLSGEHPIMDGRKHRITVEGEKFSEKSGAGFYVGHLDGHPAGYAKNNKTGLDCTWKAKGYTLDPEQKALLAAEAAATLRQREAELAQQQDQAAARVARQAAKLVPVVRPTPYLLAKGIAPQPGALTDKDGVKTYLPAVDVDGRQWTMQYIQEDGTKRFAKDSRKDGCFHVVGGGIDELAKAPAIVIGEGYATAVSLKQTLGYLTVSAFDSGNLAAVAQALHRKYPDKPVLIAGDDDRHLELTQGVNPGRGKAEEAAALVGGTALLPIFAPGENDYPAGLEPVTPKLFREHQRTGVALSAEQLAALARMKQFTDFNDLANRSALGQEGIERQLRAAVEGALERHASVQAEAIEQPEREQGPEQEQGPQPEQEQALEEMLKQAPKRQRKAKIA